jgi:hypothetical protein
MPFSTPETAGPDRSGSPADQSPVDAGRAVWAPPHLIRVDGSRTAFSDSGSLTDGDGFILS